VLFGIYGGIVTVTEAAAIAAATSMAISIGFYKGFRWQQSLDVIADALKSAGAIMLIVATARHRVPPFRPGPATRPC
jgi:C4-dicarboxylate transporter DctM subunit